MIRRPGAQSAAGVTLVEMLVALVLFALIAAAGFTVLDQVVRVQDRHRGPARPARRDAAHACTS